MGTRAERAAEPGDPGVLDARWWVPGAAVAAAVLVVASVATAGWTGYEAGGCGSPDATFACLGESLALGALAVVAGPLAGPPTGRR